MSLLLRNIMSFVLIITSFYLVAAPQKIALESYAAIPSVSMMRLSPSGERIAFQAIEGQDKYLVVKDTKTNKVIRSMNLDELSLDNLFFIDNNQVIYTASQYRSLRGYRGKHHLSSAFILNIDDKFTRQLLIPGYGVYRGQLGLGDIVGLSPDHKYAYMPAYVGRENARGNDPVMTLTKVNLKKKQKPRFTNKGTHDAIDFFVDEQGDFLARERFNDQKNIHRVDSYQDGKWVNIFSENTPYRTRSFSGLTPDRKALVMLRQNEQGRSAYYAMSLADGSVSEAIFSREDADVEQVITDIQRVVYGVKYSGFKPSYAFFDKKMDGTLKAIQKAMPDNTFTISDHTPDWKQIIFYVEGQGSAGNYLLFANNHFSYLESARPLINPETVNPVVITEYQARDKLIIPTLVTYPLRSKGNYNNLPAIILPHGGPEAYDRYGFDWLAQYFANKGMVVIQPQFRGSDGFGAQHVWHGRGEWGNKMQDDLTDAVQHFVQLEQIDQNKVCIVGMSYGGYAALAGAAFTPDLYQCAISINGVSDIEKMLDDENSKYGPDHWVLSYWNEVIAQGEIDENFVEKISPINSVKDINIPILLIHGEIDQVVSIEQSEDMEEELDDQGKDVIFIELEDEGHYLSKNKTRLEALTAIDEFINRWIQE